MTGWGEAERETDAARVRVEIRTVNHRYFNPHVRLPSGLERLQPTVEGWLKEGISRGHVSCGVDVEAVEGGRVEPAPEVDLARARGYADALRRLKDELALEGPGPTLAELARFRELFRVPDEAREAPEVGEETLRAVVREAVDAVVRHREEEGRRLRDDLEARLDALEAATEEVRERAPVRLETERERLRGRIRELTEQEEVDEDRLAREVAYLAEKWDINEELVRLASHVEMFREALDSDTAEPVGKRLSFLVQELHREVNTVGSKANDAGIARRAVEMKEEVERLREQVENVE